MRKMQLKFLKKWAFIIFFKNIKVGFFTPNAHCDEQTYSAFLHTAMNKHTAHFYMFKD